MITTIITASHDAREGRVCEQCSYFLREERMCSTSIDLARSIIGPSTGQRSTSRSHTIHITNPDRPEKTSYSYSV
jgi:hypothetical protein